MVKSRAEFSFKIIGKEGADLTKLEKGTIIFELADERGGDSKTKKVEVNYEPQTAIHTAYNNAQISPLAVTITTGSISFTVQKAGALSASLYTLSGQKVSMLLSNHQVAGTAVSSVSHVSTGLYLLKAEIVTTQGITRVEKRITLMKK